MPQDTVSNELKLNPTNIPVSLVELKDIELKELSLENGQIIFVSDKEEVYIDFNNSRKQIKDIIYLETEDEKSNILVPLPKFYYVKENNKLYFYNEDWIHINPIGSEDIDFSKYATKIELENINNNISNINFYLNNINNSLNSTREYIDLELSNTSNDINSTIQNLQILSGNVDNISNNINILISDITNNYATINYTEEEFNKVNNTINSINTNLISNYYIKNDIDEKVVEINNVISNISNNLSNYSTIENVNSIKGEINNNFSNYYTKNEIDDKTLEISNAINSVNNNLTDNYYTKNEINSSISNINETIDNVNSTVSNISNIYYNKTEIDTEIGFINNSVTDINSDVGTLNTVVSQLTENVTNIPNLYVSKTRKINNKELSEDIVLTSEDIGIVVPTKVSELENDSNFINTNIDTSPLENSSNIVTSGGVYSALAEKEPSFEKNSAFNKNFCDDDTIYNSSSRMGFAGLSEEISRADHVHPVSTSIEIAFDEWEEEDDDAGEIMLLSDASSHEASLSYLTFEKVLENKIELTPITKNTLYFTDEGNIYFGKNDTELISMGRKNNGSGSGGSSSDDPSSSWVSSNIIQSGSNYIETTTNYTITYEKIDSNTWKETINFTNGGTNKVRTTTKLSNGTYEIIVT